MMRSFTKDLYDSIDVLEGRKVEESAGQKEERLKREKKDRRRRKLQKLSAVLLAIADYAWKIIGGLCLLAGGVWSVVQLLLWLKVI